MYVLFIYYVYIYLENIYMCIYLYYTLLYINIINIQQFFLNIYMHVFVFIYTSAVKRLITSKIKVCLHNICVLFVNI